MEHLKKRFVNINNMKKLIIIKTFLLYLGLSLCSIGSIAQKYMLNGVVKDSLTGETLIGANVKVLGSIQGITTNTYGFYSLSLSKSEYNISVTYIGYKSIIKTIDLNGNLRLDFEMQIQQSKLDGVTISGIKSNIELTTMSRNEISVNKIKSITTASGESDVLKSLQLLPGIQCVNEGNSNLYVRGGSYDQNLILLDEAPIYNPTHALGFFSTFNADAIKNVTIYKGVSPAQYGGRLSSVVNITMREGNNNKTQVDAGIGLVASRLTIEGPLKKGKSSFMLSGRYSYTGQTMNLLFGKIGSDIFKLSSLKNISNQNKIWFYDLNSKINIIANSRNHIFLSVYSGYDYFYSYVLNNKNVLNWGNFTSTIRWNHIFSNSLFSNFTLYHSKYNYSSYINEDIRNFIWESNIIETGFKADFSYYLSQKSNIKMGINGIIHSFSPGSIMQGDTNSIINDFSLDKKRSAEISLYFDNDQTINKRLSLIYGLRFTSFLNLGPGTVYSYNNSMSEITDSTSFGKNQVINTYYGLEPRFSFRFKINNSSAVKLAYCFTKQYLHLLSNSTVGLPTDTWVPPDKYITPQSSNQYIIGYFRNFNKQKIDFSIEVYYKDLLNIIDFIDNADLFLNKHIETQVLSGKGRSYGMELLIEKKIGRFSGWISYTLAKTQYKINQINNGNYYSPRYDIRHNLTLTGNFSLNKSWELSSTFKLSSGGFITLPDQIFIVDNIAFFDYSARNNYKLQPYHRLDISAKYNSSKNEFRRFKSQWMFSIYNLYNWKNIYSLFVKQDPDNFTVASVYKMYLFGIVPSISYNLKF